MQPEPKAGCLLRSEFANLELADQLAMISNCHALDMEAYQRLTRKHKELADWISK